MTSRPTIFITAAEASGDLHAAHLIEALKTRRPEARFVGVGGPLMAQAGCEILADPTAEASMLGWSLLKLGYWRRTIRQVQRAIRQMRPVLHVPVDSPAMNWHLAKAARQAGSKVVYYIAPQVWAWGQWRVDKLRRLTDHVACILPFEEAWLRQRGVAATFIGHPLFDSLPERPAELPDLVEVWDEGNWRVALLAGSRPGEIHDHAAALAHVAKAIRRRWPRARCVFAAGSEEAAECLRRRVPSRLAGEVEIGVGRTHQVLAESHFALAVSGTITLEVAHFGLPMLIFYRAGWLSYRLIGRMVIRTPHLSLVNILATHPGQPGRLGSHRIVPELMPWHGSLHQLTSLTLEMMEDLGGLMDVRQRLLALSDSLRAVSPGRASDAAADLMIDVLEGRR